MSSDISCRNQAEMAHTCRGTINLASAFIHIEDSTTIVISSGGNHTFHLKATSEVDRQKWVTALELAKADAARLLEPGRRLYAGFSLSLKMRVPGTPLCGVKGSFNKI